MKESLCLLLKNKVLKGGLDTDLAGRNGMISDIARGRELREVTRRRDKVFWQKLPRKKRQRAGKDVSAIPDEIARPTFLPCLPTPTRSTLRRAWVQ